MAACAVVLPGELRCVLVEVRVIIIQCLEQDFILHKHYNTVTLLHKFQFWFIFHVN